MPKHVIVVIDGDHFVDAFRGVTMRRGYTPTRGNAGNGGGGGAGRGRGGDFGDDTTVVGLCQTMGFPLQEEYLVESPPTDIYLRSMRNLAVLYASKVRKKERDILY